LGSWPSHARRRLVRTCPRSARTRLLADTPRDGRRRRAPPAAASILASSRSVPSQQHQPGLLPSPITPSSASPWQPPSGPSPPRPSRPPQLPFRQPPAPTCQPNPATRPVSSPTTLPLTTSVTTHALLPVRLTPGGGLERGSDKHSGGPIRFSLPRTDRRAVQLAP
jgi:hypothetical protein